MSKFEITPSEINTEIRKSNSGLIDHIIPRLENEAISILIQANICNEAYYNPPFSDNSDAWRVLWVNEALHQCENFDPVGEAGGHLGQAERAAVNVLVSASSLRDALDQGKAEEAAALAMILVSDATVGGLSVELNEVIEKHNASKRIAYQKGLGKKNEDYDRMKQVVIKFAKEGWEKDPSILIRKMASDALDHASLKFSEYKTLNDFPKDNTVVAWLRHSDKSGELDIPSCARRAGRPRKSAV